MKTISRTTIVAFAFALASFASQAQAHTIIRWLPKSGVPYSVPHEEPRVTSTSRYAAGSEVEAKRTLHGVKRFHVHHVHLGQ
jgi:hypothetical protein